MSTTNHIKSNALKVTIKALRPDHRGQPYSVSFDGEAIIAKSHVPSHDACRHLVALGLSGPLDIWAVGEPYPRLHVRDIERAAMWTVNEGQYHGPRFTRYRPFDRERFMDQLETKAAMEAA